MSKNDQNSSPPGEPPSLPDTPQPTLSRRDLLKAGTLGTVGLVAATGALAIPALRELRAQDSALRYQGAPERQPEGIPEHGSHHQMNAVGDINADAFDPNAFLTRFDYGRTSKLPGGQTLREYEIVAEDR